MRTWRRAKVWINAYLRHNLGDDLFVILLCRRFPEVRFYARCPRVYSRAFNGVSNLHVMRVWSVVDGLFRKLKIPLQPGKSRIKRAESQCDVVVNIGGSIFMEKPSWRIHMEDLQLRFAPKGKNSFVLGANFGPYNDPDYRSYVASLLAQAADTCFRDKYSALTFPELRNIRYAPDMLLNIRMPAVEARDTAVISVIEIASGDNLRDYVESYSHGVANLARACSGAGLEVILMGFCKGEGDGRAVNTVLNRVRLAHPDIRIRAYIYDGNPEDALETLASCRVVIASRFHAMILGWALGKPVYPICYSMKMENVIQDLHYRGPWTTVAHAGSIDADAVVKTLLESPPFDVSAHRGSADQHFAALDRYLIKARRNGTD